MVFLVLLNFQGSIIVCLGVDPFGFILLELWASWVWMSVSVPRVRGSQPFFLQMSPLPPLSLCSSGEPVMRMQVPLVFIIPLRSLNSFSFLLLWLGGSRCLLDPSPALALSLRWALLLPCAVRGSSWYLRTFSVSAQPFFLGAQGAPVGPLPWTLSGIERFIR